MNEFCFCVSVRTGALFTAVVWQLIQAINVVKYCISLAQMDTAEERQQANMVDIGLAGDHIELQ